jgi:hypothetical protein
MYLVGNFKDHCRAVCCFFPGGSVFASTVDAALTLQGAVNPHALHWWRRQRDGDVRESQMFLDRGQVWKYQSVGTTIELILCLPGPGGFFKFTRDPQSSPWLLSFLFSCHTDGVGLPHRWDATLWNLYAVRMHLLWRLKTHTGFRDGTSLRIATRVWTQSHTVTYEFLLHERYLLVI